jgi:hypothetical protein
MVKDGAIAWYSIRPFFHWRFSQAFVPLWFGSGVGMILANKFVWAYAFFGLFFVWSVACWFASDYLREKEKSLESKRLRRDVERFHKAKNSYLRWKWIVFSLILLLAVFCLGAVRITQIEYELRSLYGLLLPANDPDPLTPHCATKHADGLKVYLGDELAMTVKTFPFNPVGVYERHQNEETVEPLITIDKDAHGNIVLTTNVKNRDNKLIAQINRNVFTISEQKIFRTYREHPDKSTIVVQDEYGHEALYVRYLNPHSIIFSGILYYLPGEAFVIKGKKVGSGIYDNTCFNVDVKDATGVAVYPTK